MTEKNGNLADGMRWVVLQEIDGERVTLAAFRIHSDAELFARTLREYGNQVAVEALRDDADTAGAPGAGHARIDHDNAEADRRIAAYVAFLCGAYLTDLDGVADIAGIDRDAMAEFVSVPFEQKDAFTMQKLGRLTGISFSWLFAESIDGTEAQPWGRM